MARRQFLIAGGGIEWKYPKCSLTALRAAAPAMKLPGDNWYLGSPDLFAQESPWRREHGKRSGDSPHSQKISRRTPLFTPAIFPLG
jgi:hypothetical protein